MHRGSANKSATIKAAATYEDKVFRVAFFLRCGYSGRDIRIAASPQTGLCGERAQLFFGQGALYARPW